MEQQPQSGQKAKRSWKSYLRRRWWIPVSNNQAMSLTLKFVHKQLFNLFIYLLLWMVPQPHGCDSEQLMVWSLMFQKLIRYSRMLIMSPHCKILASQLNLNYLFKCYQDVILKRFSGPISSGILTTSKVQFTKLRLPIVQMAQGYYKSLGQWSYGYHFKSNHGKWNVRHSIRELGPYFHVLPGGTWGDLLDKIPQHEHSPEVFPSQAPSKQRVLQLYILDYHQRYWSNFDRSKPVQSQVWWPLLQ